MNIKQIFEKFIYDNNLVDKSTSTLTISTNKLREMFNNSKICNTAISHQMILKYLDQLYVWYNNQKNRELLERNDIRMSLIELLIEYNCSISELNNRQNIRRKEEALIKKAERINRSFDELI